MTTAHVGLYCFDAGTVTALEEQQKQPLPAHTHLISIQKLFSPVFHDVFFAFQETDSWKHKRFDSFMDSTRRPTQFVLIQISRSWIRLLYSAPMASVLANGTLSAPFPPQGLGVFISVSALMEKFKLPIFSKSGILYITFPPHFPGLTNALKLAWEWDLAVSTSEEQWSLASSSICTRHWFLQFSSRVTLMHLPDVEIIYTCSGLVPKCEPFGLTFSLHSAGHWELL